MYTLTIQRTSAITFVACNTSGWLPAFCDRDRLGKTFISSHRVWLCTSKNIYILAHCDVWVSQMCTNKKHLYPHTVCVCKSKNIYLLTHCDEWVSHMCSAHIKLFLSSQRVCLCFTDMFEQKTFKPSQAKCIRVCVSQIFTGVYRCLEMFTRKKKTFISLSLCGRAEWRCLIIAWRQETGLCFANEKHCGWHLSCCTTHDPQQDTNNCRFCKDFSNAQMMLIISCQIVQDATYLRWHLFWSAS